MDESAATKMVEFEPWVQRRGRGRGVCIIDAGEGRRARNKLEEFVILAGNDVEVEDRGFVHGE